MYMNSNEFDLDFDFEKEYGFEPSKDDDTKKLDTDFDLRAALESEFNEEAALFNSEYQNDFDYGPELTEDVAEEVEIELPEDFEETYPAEEEFAEEPVLTEDILAEELDQAEPVESPEYEKPEETPTRQRRVREKKDLGKFIPAVIAFFAPEEPKPAPDGRPRKPVSKMRRIKNDVLPLAITAVTLLMILIFIFGAASRAITNMRNEQEAMKSSSEEAKTQDELEAEQVRILLIEADALAAGYDYDGAIAKLESFTGNKSKYSEIEVKLSTYRQAKDSLIEHNDPGAIPNLSFHVLIADPARAFVDQTFGGKYNMNFVTTGEFQRILEQLYANGYVLVDMDSFIAETETGGSITYASKPLRLPDGKKPVMITETMVNYFRYMIDTDDDYEPDKDGAGFASKLVVDPLTGAITAEMVKASGETVRGDYDLVPILEKFIEAHPDFCYQGARATLAVCGYDGIFGYRINSEVIEKKGQEFYDKEVAGARELVAALQAKGYEIACYTYDNIGYGGKSATDIKEDMAKWEKDIMPVVGTLDTFVYAQKSDISSTGAYTGNKFNVLHDMGFRYFISNGNKPACTVTNTYVRQLRVMVTGTAMAHTGTMYSDFFDAKTVLDSTRGDVPQA